jgi:hypothetical protein
LIYGQVGCPGNLAPRCTGLQGESHFCSAAVECGESCSGVERKQFQVIVDPGLNARDISMSVKDSLIDLDPPFRDPKQIGKLSVTGRQYPAFRQVSPVR